MQLRLSIEASLIRSFINFSNLLYIFSECHDTGAHLLTSALLEVKELTIEKERHFFYKMPGKPP